MKLQERSEAIQFLNYSQYLAVVSAQYLESSFSVVRFGISKQCTQFWSCRVASTILVKWTGFAIRPSCAVAFFDSPGCRFASRRRPVLPLV
ncbi:hypothetical protein D918_06267 [Trichuris suis]|nr:hypothetical protein D918_06267 [Trichuris suis]